MNPVLIHNALIINEGVSAIGSVLIEGSEIKDVFLGNVPESVLNSCDIVDATGKWLIPGVIDDHVHFRDPGLTHKADLITETRAALAGGVTSFMEMPNTIPQTTTIKAWEEKMVLASEKALANYAFYFGATNDNLPELQKADYNRVCGIKVFMGSSTGNMLVDNERILEGIFRTVPSIVAVHAESEGIIQANKKKYFDETGGILPIKYHPLIRSAEACYESSARAVELATKYDTRLHLMHLSTELELGLLENKSLRSKRITSEACGLHLWFESSDYEKFGNAIKCNPAVKSKKDRNALRKAVASGLIDVVSTDHAPHLWEEKQGDCLKSASGAPSVQFSLPLMLEMVSQGCFSKEVVVERMCHAPAALYRIEKRGFIRPGYYADLVLIDPVASWTLNKEMILSKCNWSPFEGQHFTTQVYQTWLNGQLVNNQGRISDKHNGMSLKFE